MICSFVVSQSRHVIGFFPPVVTDVNGLSETFETRLLTFQVYLPWKAGASHTGAPEVPSCLPERWRCGAETCALLGSLCVLTLSASALQATSFVAPSASQPGVAERQLQRPEGSRPQRFSSACLQLGKRRGQQPAGAVSCSALATDTE